MATLFISCVSDEFANYRDAIRKDFTRPNLETKIQEDFIAYGGATMEKLDDYIQDCDAVIHIFGDMAGQMANKLSLEYINNKYKDFAARFPDLQPVIDGSIEASYTQWEAYLAAYHRKKLFIVAPTESAIRNNKYVKEPAQVTNQLAHIKRLRNIGHYAEITFDTEDQLVKNLYRSRLGDILNAIPKVKAINLPYHSIGTAFKGREDFMSELHEMFSSATNDIAGTAIYSLGGMGKTRLAVEYAWQHKDDYTALLFVTAASPDLIKNNIANLSDPLVLNLPESVAQDEEIKYASVINWLNQYTGWLLIFDNVDTIEAAEKVEEVFSKLQQGNVLITSRVDSWSGQIKKKQLEVLDTGAAIAFLLETTEGNRIKSNDDDETAKAIVNDLGCLALALQQAKAYIITKELSLVNYRKKWEANRIEVMGWYNKQQMQYPASVAITWQTSFNQLSGAAIILLNRLAWLAPAPIPKTLLEFEIPDIENIDAVSAWEELKQYSLAASSGDKTTFTVHRLVLDVARSKQNEAEAMQTFTEALNWVNIAFNKDPTDVRDWPYLEPLIPHVLSLIEYAKEYTISEPTSRLMNQVALIFLNKAQYQTAEPLMRRALEIDEQSFGANHPNVAIRLNNLAQLLKDTNRLAKAEPLMRRALEIDEQSFGANHPNIARDLNNLAQLLQATNRLAEAEPLMRRSLEIDEQSFGANHPNVARDLSNLAALLQDTNRLAEAEPLMRRALQIDEQSFGLNHPNVAIYLNNLAQLLKATNRLAEAEPLMRRALEIDEQSLGANHPNVAIRLNNLAQLLNHTNRLAEAESLMRRALEIDEQNLGANHPNVAIRLNNLAQLLQDTNRLAEAEPLMRRALEIDEQSFGANHPNIARDLNNLAQLLQDTNHLAEAEPLFKQALIIFFNSLGEDHPSTQTVRNNYTILLEKMGKTEEEIMDILEDCFNVV